MIEKLIELLNDGKVDEAKSLFKTYKADAEKALEQYDVSTHAIMKRQDRMLKDNKVDIVAKLPIGYQEKIVQSAVAFLFGKPVEIKQVSEGTEEVFGLLTDLLNDMRMNSINQEVCEYMLSEIECAKLFVEYKPSELSEDELKKPNVVKLKCIILANSLGDTLYTMFDSYGVLKAFGRGYEIELGTTKNEHLDIYTSENIYNCKKEGVAAWQVVTDINKIGKIPVGYYLHPKKKPEWAPVQPLIERRENLTSKRADNNDRTADPILVLEGGVVSLPDKDQVGKTVQLEPGGKATYLVPQMSVDMVNNEKEDLKELIHYLTDTPDISMDKMSSLGLTSGKAIEMVFFGALLKAMRRHGFFQELIDREINIILAFISKIINTSLADEAKRLKTSIVFGNPLPDNVQEMIEMLSTSTGGKAIISQKTAVSLNPLVKEAEQELENIKDETVSEDPNDI